MRNHLLVLMGLVLSLSLTAKADDVQAPQKDWNFLIFLNGVNNLDSFATINLKQMEEVGSNDHINIIVEWGSSSRDSVDRLLIQKSTDASQVTSPVVQSLGQVDMGSMDSVVDFVKWANTKYPAKHTFLAIWDHGGGWHKPSQPMMAAKKFGMHPQDISWDDRTGNNITTEQLGAGMATIAGILGHPIDIYGSDACLMGMAEVADQMASSVSYFVGSQDTEPGAGWPYSTFLKDWNDNVNMSAKDVAGLLAVDYTKSYSAGGIYGDQNSVVTMAAYDMSKLPAFLASIKSLSAELVTLSPAKIQGMITAANTAKSFQASEDYKDLLDLMDKTDMDHATKGASTVRSAHAALVYANAQNQDNVTHGLSVWLPSENYDYTAHSDRYEALQFNKDTGWGAFVKLMNPADPNNGNK